MPELTDEQVSALEQRATAGEEALANLSEVQQQLETVQAGSATAHAALLETTRAANPTIPADLIAGDNADQIAASVTTGAAIVAQVQEANPPPKAAAPTAPSTNAGAPPRTEQPPDNLRGVSRIAWGIEHDPN